MVTENVSQRPTCEQILRKKHLWALKEEEFQIDAELKKIIYSKGHSSAYSMLRSKMILDKANHNWCAIT
jgi:hypothetical protein